MNSQTKLQSKNASVRTSNNNKLSLPAALQEQDEDDESLEKRVSALKSAYTLRS